MVFSEEIRGMNKIYFDRVISLIKSQGVTILVVMLNAEQDSILVTRALNEGLLYPLYTWIHVEKTPDWLVNEELHDQATIFSGIQGPNLSFKGAGGLVEFNQYRSVSTPVQIIWFIGETERNVGVYNPLKVVNLHTSINACDLPEDR